MRDPLIHILEFLLVVIFVLVILWMLGVVHVGAMR